MALGELSLHAAEEQCRPRESAVRSERAWATCVQGRSRLHVQVEAGHFGICPSDDTNN